MQQASESEEKMEEYSIQTVMYHGGKTKFYVLFRDGKEILKSYDGILPILAFLVAMKIKKFEIDGKELTMEGFELLFR